MTYYVYIITNKPKGTLYIGVTNDLVRRVYEHKNGLCDGYSKRYNLQILVYFEQHDDITFAIQREKTLKKWFHEWKAQLIENNNPKWIDLYETLF